MKTGMQNTETILEFGKLKEKWKEQALTRFAKERIEAIVPFLEEKELRVQLRETTQGRMMIEKGGNPPLVSLCGIEKLLGIAEKGDCLSPSQLEELEQALVAVRRLKEYLARCRQFQIPLSFYEENLNTIGELREAIGMQIRNGGVDDRASKELFSIRGDIIRAEERMKEKAEGVMRQWKDCMSDSFSTFRNGRLCVPVKKEYKYKISGSVIDKSATGNTLFIEPAAVAKYSEELQLLRIDEENEERRILYVLTGMAADAADRMRQNIRMMERLDFIFSKGKLSLALNAAEPLINTERRIILEGARHPLMEQKSCVPLQFSLGGETRGIVITGPNTGGKTVAIKTVALNCMMAQCGLHVTCTRADICMNSNYLCDIGDGQSLSENLSTFSAHIKNVLSVLKEVGEESLVILDELGSGTDPAEGMGIAIAILEELRSSGCLFLATTHYPEVKQYAEEAEGVVNAKMTFDRDTLSPLYQMVIGEAGESCAFSIAARLGMPKTMLQTAARAAYGNHAEYQSFFPEEIAGKETNPVKKPGSQAKIQKNREYTKRRNTANRFQPGDSVMVYPEKKIGIVCRQANEKGVLQVQMPEKKIWINHKRVKLHIAAAELYPEDYDFSILFDTVENRKRRHQMERRYVEGIEIHVEEDK